MTKTIRDDLVAIASDLDLLENDLRWAYTNAHWPTGRGLDAPRGASLAAPADPHDPDHVSGPRHDVGIGDFPSRRAWRLAVGWLVFVEMRLALALELAAPRQPQPVVVRPMASTPLPVVLEVIDACRWRVGELGRWQAARAPNVRSLVQAARKNLDGAVRDLSRALHQGPALEATGEKPCLICKIRPRGERKGGRCETCAAWRRRNPNRGERPTSIDDEVVGSAHRAAARRRARGEGWGEA